MAHDMPKATYDEYFRAATDGDYHFFETHAPPPNLERKNKRGRTLLYCAARESVGHYQVAEFLLVYGANVNAREDSVNSTPLHGAAYYGNKEIVGLLLGFGADETARNRYNNTPEDEASPDVANLIRNHSMRINRFHVPREGALRFIGDDLHKTDRYANDPWLDLKVSRASVVKAVRDIGRGGGHLLPINGSDRQWHEGVIKLYTSNHIHKQFNADLNALNKESPYWFIASALQAALLWRRQQRDYVPWDGTTWRGASGFTDSDRDDYRSWVGKNVLWLQFASSTKERKFAEQWTNCNTIFEIHVPQDYPSVGVDIEDISVIESNEREVLFHGGSEFRVESVDVEGCLTVIRVVQSHDAGDLFD